MDSRTDEQFVTAHLGGEREALAGIYDRYGDALHDTAAAMLRDRHEAADATQDVFLIASERLGQLRDPSRLKPWLFAILRNEVYRRTRRRSRDRPTDFSAPGVIDVPDVADAGDEATAGVAYAALAESVRLAAAGLDRRDQLVLELSVRQGLSGPDLAAALGVTADQSYVLLHRMRQRVERSLGALAVARAGRKDCSELQRILAGWDGAFNVLVRKRVSRHVEACDICAETKRRYAALALFGAAPAFAAPPSLRELVLAPADGASAELPYDFTADGGFPTMARIARRGAVTVVAAVVIGVLIVVGAGTAVVLSRGGGEGDTLVRTESVAVAESAASSAVTTTDAPANAAASTNAAGSTTTTTPVAPTVPSSATTASLTTPPAIVVTTSTASTSTSAATAAPTTTASTPTTSRPPTPDPGFLELSSSLVELGAEAGSATLTLRNTGGTAISWALEGDPDPFTWESGSQALGPGASSSIEFSIDRTQLAEGTVSRALAVTTDGGGGGPVEVTARVERAPIVRIHNVAPRVSCPWRVPPFVEATASDESGLSSVELGWSGPGSPDSTAMGQRGDSWNGRLDIEPVNGTWTYVVTATDDRGNAGSDNGALTVDGC